MMAAQWHCLPLVPHPTLRAPNPACPPPTPNPPPGYQDGAAGPSQAGGAATGNGAGEVDVPVPLVVVVLPAEDMANHLLADRAGGLIRRLAVAFPLHTLKLVPVGLEPWLVRQERTNTVRAARCPSAPGYS
jgi:hypothetical protein